MSDKPEFHEIAAENGDKDSVVMLIDGALQAAKDLPRDKRYNVTIKIKENND